MSNCKTCLKDDFSSKLVLEFPEIILGVDILCILCTKKIKRSYTILYNELSLTLSLNVKKCNWTLFYGPCLYGYILEDTTPNLAKCKLEFLRAQ
jgi:hypothetical protein